MAAIIDKTRQDKTRQDKSYCANSHRDKILLVTLYGNYNYGNILQRCALTKILEHHNFEVEHLCPISQPGKLQHLKNFIKHILAFIGVEKYRKYFQEAIRDLTRTEKFKAFQDSHIGHKIFMTFHEILNAPKSRWEEYKFALIGSDQVWHNWSNTNEELECYYLEFMPREKRINYAPSFGFSEFDTKSYKAHKNGLSGFERLSCREVEGCDLIRHIIGANAQNVLDPTLLLNAEQLRKFSRRPNYIVPEHYMLTYFLGRKIPEYTNAINNTAGNLPVINLGAPGELEHYVTDPGEFVYLFDHADFVCTDSFHGTAFSVSFGVNFLTFRRLQENGQSAGMFGRIDGLLANLHLLDHIYEHGIRLPPANIDYNAVNARLNDLRISSMKYLHDCLKV